MYDILEYYLSGGKLTIGRKEATLELLRSGSALRFLLGYGAGDLKTLVSNAVKTDAKEETVTLDLSGGKERKLASDPAEMLKDLKRRYGESVGGRLFFRIFYPTSRDSFFLEADLDDPKVGLRMGSYMCD